jgi:hypothetical protein
VDSEADSAAGNFIGARPELYIRVARWPRYPDRDGKDDIVTTESCWRGRMSCTPAHPSGGLNGPVNWTLVFFTRIVECGTLLVS